MERTSANDTGSADRLISRGARTLAAGRAAPDGKRATTSTSSTAITVTIANASRMPPTARKPKASGGPMATPSELAR